MRNLAFPAMTWLFMAGSLSAQTSITIEEPKIRALFRDDRTVITIPLQAGWNAPLLRTSHYAGSNQTAAW